MTFLYNLLFVLSGFGCLEDPGEDCTKIQLSDQKSVSEKARKTESQCLTFGNLYFT